MRSSCGPDGRRPARPESQVAAAASGACASDLRHAFLPSLGAVGGLATASTALFALRLISSAVAVQSAPRPLLREVSWWRRRVLFVLFLWDFGRTRQFSLSLAVPLPFRYHGGYDFYPPYLSRYLLRLSVTPPLYPLFRSSLAPQSSFGGWFGRPRFPFHASTDSP